MCDVRMFKRILKSNFIKQNAILLFGAVAVGFLNYLFYPVVGRLLEPSAFGEVQVIFSLFLQLTIFLAVLGTVVVFVVTNNKGKERDSTVLELEKASLWVAVAVLAVMILAGEWLKATFKFESAMPFLWLGALLVVSAPLALRTAFLRGKKNFADSAAANFLAALGKFLFSVPLVLFGLGSGGALAGVALGQAGAMVYAAWRSKRAGLSKPIGFSFWHRPHVSKIWPELKYSLFVLVGSLAVMLQLTVDVLAVKYWFDPHTAGLYSGVSTVARTVFFLTMPIVLALLPNISLSSTPKVNNGQLIKSLVLLGVISLPLLAAMVVFPQQIVTILMGQNYVEVADLLPQLAIATFFISLTNVVFSYFLALKRYITALLGIIGFAATFGLMLFHHESLQAVVESLLVGSVASMCLIAIWLIRERLTSRRSIDEAATTLHSGPGLQRSQKHSVNPPSVNRNHK